MIPTQTSTAATKVVVTDYTFDDLSIEQSVLEPLGCRIAGQKFVAGAAALAGLVSDAAYVITQFAPIDAAVIAAMANCRLIVRYGIGVDNVDLAIAASKKIPVCNVSDYCTDEVADHTLAMILDLVRRITPNALRVRDGGWAWAFRSLKCAHWRIWPSESSVSGASAAKSPTGFGRSNAEFWFSIPQSTKWQSVRPATSRLRSKRY